MEKNWIDLIISIAPYVFGTSGALGFVYFILSYLQKSIQVALEHFEKNKDVSQMVLQCHLEAADRRAEYLERTAPTYRIRNKWKRYRKEVIKRDINIIQKYQNNINELNKKINTAKNENTSTMQNLILEEKKNKTMNIMSDYIINNLKHTIRNKKWRMISIFKFFVGTSLAVGDHCNMTLSYDSETSKHKLIANQVIGNEMNITVSENTAIQLTDSENTSYQVHFTAPFINFDEKGVFYLCLLYVTCGSEVPDNPVRSI